jgi:hypothetical protein
MERGCQKGFFDVWKTVQKDIVLDAFLLIPFGIVLSRFFFSKKALMNFPSLGNMTYWKFRFTTTAARLDHYEIEKRSWGERKKGGNKRNCGRNPENQTENDVSCYVSEWTKWLLDHDSRCRKCRVSMYIWHLYWNRLARLRYRPTARRETQKL